MKLLLAIMLVIMISIFAILLVLIFFGMVNYYMKTYERYKSTNNDFILICKSLVNDAFKLALAIIVMVMIVGFISILIDFAVRTFLS